MSITRSDGTTLEFDISKIIDALQKAFEVIAERIQEMTQGFFTVAHDLAHLLMHFFRSFSGRKVTKKAVIRYICAVQLPIANYKSFVISYLEHACVTRKLILISRHHNSNYFRVSASF